MECRVCNIRSSVGYCAECRELLCEECGLMCTKCGKMVCPSHYHETSSGKTLCLSCYQERKARRAEQKRHRRHGGESEAAAGTSFASLEGTEAAPDEEQEGGVSAVALTESGYRLAAPWKVSLYSALGGLAGVLLVLIFPTIWWMLLPVEGRPYLPYLFILIPLLPAFAAISWATFGLMRSEYLEDRARCLGSLAIAIVAVFLGVVAAAQAPTDVVVRKVNTYATERQEDMTEQQLARWREERLRRYLQK